MNDLTGKMFGNLLVLGKTEQRRNKYIVWKCECQCENKSILYLESYLLTTGRKRSCGCDATNPGWFKRKDITGKRFNRLIAVSPTDETKGTSVIWRCHCDCGKIAYVPIGELTSGRVKSCGCLQKEVMRERGNRNMQKILKENAVFGTRIDNITYNKLKSNNTTGYTGVWKDKRNGKYAAEIGFQGKKYRLGEYETAEEAGIAYLNAKEKIHGSFLEWYYNTYKKDDGKNG